MFNKSVRLLRRALSGDANLYFLEQRLLRAQHALRKNPPSKRLWAFALRLLRQNDYLLDYERFESAMLAEQAVEPLDYADFFALNDTVVLTLCQALSQKSAPGVDIAVKTVRFLDSYSFLPFLEKHSYTERILLGADSHLFAASDATTRAQYREQIVAYAKAHQMKEQEAARALCNTLRLSHSHPFARRLYFPLLLSCSLTLTVLCGIFTASVWASLLLFLPLYAIAKQVIDRMYGACIKPRPLPRLALSDIPKEGQTLVVITSLLFGPEKDRALIERLEQFYLKNPYENTMFALLSDLRDSDRATTAQDRETLEFIKSEIARLNRLYENRFCFLVRQRTYNAAEGRFMGYERKRGAVLELCRAIAGKEHSFFESELPHDFLRDTRYLITLDADTDLSMGAVCHLVATMLHPENRPVIKNGRVVEGYAVLQPRMEPSLATCADTPFSVLQCGNGGTDVYANAAFDLYQSVFAEGIFCGKGIIDLSCYHTLLDCTFPENTILSHDLLEGSFLRCANLVDFALTDSYPKTPLSDLARTHRWIRGDVQALPYVRRHIRTQSGERIKNPLSRLSRFKLIDNLRRILTPIAATVALTVALFLSRRAAMLLLSTVFLCYLLPFFFSVFDTARHASRRFFSHVLGGMWRSFLFGLYQIAILLPTSLSSLDAILRAIYRMRFSKKHLLEWVTASESDRARFSGDAYLLRFFPSFALGVLLLFFSPYGAFHLLGTLWCLSGPVSYWISRPFPAPAATLGEKGKRELSQYAKVMWQYYEDFVTEEHHYLPPDNYQILPTEVIAARTSPTNIGLYLLCILAAKDFSLITTEELTKRLEYTLATVEALPHWHGHLYNWYDTRSLSLLGVPYVSTVDSGNFVTCVLCAAQGVLEYAFEDARLHALSKRLYALADRADFSLLYDNRRHLFVIGYDTASKSFGENHYDFYMSEARTTSYYAIGCGMVEREHWRHLRRPLIAKNHFLGMQSWSGTMFEYFMPTLLLPVYENSLQSEALHFAYAMQATASTRGVFGRSESGYFHFDADLNYQYRAFGVSELSQQGGMERQNVIAPYASFLALRVCPDGALANLKALTELGALGKYGFFEAIDFTPGRVSGEFALVRSFMAHHIGMSLIAAANASFDDVFVKRFCQDARMRAATELLMEKIPVDAPILRRNRQKIPKSATHTVHTIPSYQSEENTEQTPDFSIFSNAKTRLITTSHGQIGLFHEGLTLWRDNLKSADPLEGLHLFIECDGKVYDALGGVYLDGGSYCRYEKKSDSLSLQSSFTLLGEIPCLCLHIDAVGAFRKITPTLLFEPILARQADYDAHPAFSKLSLEAEYDADRNLLLFHRRPRTPDEQDLYLGVSFLFSTPFDFTTRRDSVLGLCYEREDLLRIPTLPLDHAEGACIDPLCVVKKTSESESGRYSCDLLVFHAKRKEDIFAWLGMLRAKESGAGKRFSFFDLAQRSLSLCMRALLNGASITQAQIPCVRLLLSALHRPIPPDALTAVSTVTDLWQHGISGDLPIVTVSLEEAPTQSSIRAILTALLRAHRFLALCGVRLDLVFLCQETDRYLADRQDALLRLVCECGSELFLGHKGGIYLLDADNAPPYLLAHQCLFIKPDLYTTFEHIRFEYRNLTKPVPIPAIHTHVCEPYEADCAFASSQGAVYGGDMEEDRFTVYKGSQRAPWSYLYTERDFGTLLTQNSLGYTWWKNAREGRLTPFSNDTLRDLQGERLLYHTDGELYDLCACSNRVSFCRGCARYEGRIGQIPYTVEVGVDAQLGVKLIRVLCAKKEQIRLHLDLILGVDAKDARTVTSQQNKNTVFYSNFGNVFFADAVAYLSQFDDGEYRCFLLGIYERSNADRFDIVWEKYHSAASFSLAFDRYAQKAQQLCSQITVETGNVLFDRCVNFYIPYQAFYARLFGRSGFYQSGGAFGFRDQLQDSLAALYADSDLTRTQILLAARRQFIEGDVLHWWHEEPYLRGIRTRCSDDLLWLPYACALYCEAVDSDEILDTSLPYLSAPALAENETERYSVIGISDVAEPLYLHCVRAIDRACRFGRHNLPLMGSGDWNDGMNRIGERGQGESVWLGLFLQLVLRKMIPLCERREDSGRADRYRLLLHQLSQSIERYCYEDDHYLRAFFDDGTPIGSSDAPCCKIDLLPQAFRAILDGDAPRAKTALHTAYARLYEKEGGLLRLFAPSIPADDRRFGYISGYVDGVRENGGQYTHAAIWAAWGFYALGEPKTAFDILRMQNPALRAKSELAMQYRTEPYAIAADIYAAKGHVGRGGWTHYTGSAAWYYRIFLTETLGYCERADSFSLRPALCASLPKIKVTLRRKDTVYLIEARQGEQDSVRLDGKAAKFPLFFDKKSHFLEIVVEKSSDLL